MVASVTVEEHNGTSGAEVRTDKTSGNVRFKLADNATVDLVNPIVIPGSGQEHSMEKFLRMRLGATGPSSELTNLTVYSDAANGLGTGVNLYYVGLAAYATPVVPSNGDAIPEHSAVAMTDMFGLSSGSPLVLGAGPFSTINTDIGNFLCLVMTAASTAAPGVTPSETITFSYDEV